MIRNAYRFETARREGLLVVRLYGEIDHHSAAALREEIDALLLAERPARLVLDLAHIDFMDSAGLGFLMGRLRTARQIGGTVALRAPNTRVRKILQLAGMERFFEIDGMPKGEGR